ncbi:glycosyltransferase family 4 protein [Zunongwangia sp. H14]|uniref:glycosyltransferase family 4 protein n=1 Tax=Zunongwangia sp. H14 TaxID=3240792 RepID=UPI0035650FAE
MYLGFLTPEYPHSSTNASAGLGSSIKNMATGLVNAGIEVTVFVYGQKTDNRFREEGINFHLIKQRNYRFLGWYLYRKHLQAYLNKFIVSEKIDAIEAPDWTGITAFMQLKCPLVLRVHGSDAYFCHLEKRPQKKKNFWFEKTALKSANHLISVSAFTAEKTQELFQLKKEIQVIPNAIDVNKFIPDQTKFEPDTILYFGSIIRKKGVLELAHIFNLINQIKPNVKLSMAGRDVYDIKEGIPTSTIMKQKLSECANKMVEWKGMLPYDEILDLIAAASVIALPSYAEALPMTWIEAMAMEKALVTSNIGWAREVMVNGETGYTVAPENHQEYAEKIIELLENKKMAEKMGEAARKRVKQHFSTEVVTRQNIYFYKQIITHT